MSLVQDVIRTAKSLAVGHSITLREFFKKPITIRYPEEKPDYVKGVRGIPALKVNDEGELNCTGCGLCARACPVSIIEVQQGKEKTPEGKTRMFPTVYNLDFTRCLVCNLCIEACPFDALEMSDYTELSQFNQDDLVFNKEQLSEIWKNSKAVRIAGGEKI